MPQDLSMVTISKWITIYPLWVFLLIFHAYKGNKILKILILCRLLMCDILMLTIQVY